MEAVFRTRRAGVLFSVLLLTSLLQSIHARDLAAEEVYPNDPLFRGDPFGGVEEQWNLMSDGRGIGATEAWEVTKGSPDVVIANLDSGIHYRHEDLRNQIYLNRGELPLPLDAQGREPQGWPKFTGGWIVCAPTVGDMDADGLLEVLLNTREGDLLAWDTQGDARQEPMWWSFHHDNHATGNYHVDTEPPDAIEDLRVTRAEGEGHPGLRLTWTAVGDNAKQGRATAYEIRSHSESIDPFNWPEAQTVTVSLTPREAGESESVFLPDFSPDTFVAVRAVDEAGNLSGLYPEQAEPPASGGSSENAHGGCGCSLFPGTGPKGPWQPVSCGRRPVRPARSLRLAPQEEGPQALRTRQTISGRSTRL